MNEAKREHTKAGMSSTSLNWLNIYDAFNL